MYRENRAPVCLDTFPPPAAGAPLGKRMASVKENQNLLTELRHISPPVRDEVKIARRFIGGNSPQPKHLFRPVRDG